MSEPVCHIDIETFSKVDLKKAGGYVYAKDESTILLCVAYAFDDGPVHLWVVEDEIPEEAWPRKTEHVHVGMTCPRDLAKYASKGSTLFAHNAAFERNILNGAAGRKAGFPVTELAQWKCTLAMAANAAIPRDLKGAAKAMKTHPKDENGRGAMLQLSKPRRPSKDNPSERWLVADVPEKFRTLYDYNVDDVLAERSLHHALPELSAREQQFYWLDQMINDRGVHVDREAVENAIDLVDQRKAQLEEQCLELTGWKPTQTKQVAEWVREQGYDIENLQKATIAQALEDPDCPKDVRRALKIRNTHAMKAVAKYTAMLMAMDPDDDHVRGMFVYYGANTGRWCLTGDHEVLTSDGWVRLDEWRGGRIACWSEEGAVTFDSAAPVSFEYEGDLVEWTTERFAQLATPEHRMPIEGRPGGLTVEEVHTKHRIPRTGVMQESSRFSEAEVRALVMLQADGHRADGEWKLAFTKSRKVFRCRHLLRLLGVEFRENRYGDGRTVFSVAHSRSEGTVLSLLGKDKTFPWELVAAHHDAFFEELEQWDGYRCGPASIQYVTTNAANAALVQAKAHLSGRQCNVVQKNREHDGWSTAYYCNVWLSDAPASTRQVKDRERRVPFSGRVYCAKTRTGYFLVRRNGPDGRTKCWVTGNSSRIVQLQNLFRPLLKSMDVESAIAAMGERELQWLIDLFGLEPMKVLASCVRGMLVPSEGKILRVADYSSIEGRVLAWLAGQHDKLEVFRTHGLIYEYTAAKIHGMNYDDLDLLKRMKNENPDARFEGKTSELALGYQGGGGALMKMANNYGVDLEEWRANEIKWEWREANAEIVSFWYALEQAAAAAVARPGKVFSCGDEGRIKFCLKGRWLHCRLPSGRMLRYLDPSLNEDGQVEYFGMNTYTRVWGRVPTYGGRLAENVTQAVSRDIMANGMVTLYKAGYDLIGSVHDEVLSETDPDFGSTEEMEELMCVLPAWADGLPVAAEGFSGPRYRK